MTLKEGLSTIVKIDRIVSSWRDMRVIDFQKVKKLKQERSVIVRGIQSKGYQ